MDRVQIRTFIELCDSQADAARRIGINPQTLNNWLRRSPERYEVVMNADRTVVKVTKDVNTARRA